MAYSIALSMGQEHKVGLYSWTFSKGRDRDSLSRCALQTQAFSF